jgi:hypothetical protein
VAETRRTGQRIAAAERRAEVVRLRRGRASFDEIGRALGVTKQRAHAIYKKALAEVPRTQVEEHLAEELALIDDAISDLLKLARDHRRPRSAVDAWNAIARYIELEARLLDLFPPAKSRVSVITEEAVQAEIDQICVKFIAEGEWTEVEAKAHGWSGHAGADRRALPPGRRPAFDDVDVIDVDPGEDAA